MSSSWRCTAPTYLRRAPLYVHLFLRQTSYNFREYFVRRTRDLFRARLYPSSESTQHVNTSAEKLSNLSTAKQSVTGIDPASVNSAEKLAQFYEDMQAELRVLQRAAVTNMMYAGDRLIVEEAGAQAWSVRSHEEEQVATHRDA